MAEPEQETDLTFEDAIARLESVAHRLENPETPLDEAVALFEEGVRLARRCSEQLESAELKIQELRPDDIEPEEETNAD